MKETALLEVDGLSTTFLMKKSRIRAVDGVSFRLDRGEIVGIVGESGCGKSVTSQSILRLYDERREALYEGDVRLEGKSLFSLSEREMEMIRGDRIAMIFQDALTSLNPCYTVGDQLAETLRLHRGLSHRQAREAVLNLLRQVEIPEPERRARQYPHELSGGMRQRVMIAIALSCQPDVLIADEPTTALDVTVQAQIMALFQRLRASANMGILLISHDMAVVSENCDRVIVMYLGQVVEEAGVCDIFDWPRHPYTAGLIRSIPRMDTATDRPLPMIEGGLPLLSDVRGGCRFASRCPRASERCMREEPELKSVAEGRLVRCFAPMGEGENYE